MPKYVYGIICLFVAAFVFYTSYKCAKRKEAINEGMDVAEAMQTYN